ncbi:hypothetical protein FHX82_002051 [Amycolatopsis bartoniae]|uniref:Uncharacterized protein n=1 Tax=Amycolatopsis bartoniae TaxID=941986 RepID=A0A8H9J3W8_9PSEU|nr:hypothetical protein [Amycolatopsis bartoniae]MBB2935031.1 hypothetical protein [Amycolatopsis bartoniae]GHF73840.1 hypothetical protein GCM10017566_54470 [Amycolatopsis bartoniae]
MAEEKEQKTGLKPAQIVASALAAVTAAFLGSTLGVGGTVAGAGIASVITTIGSEVYLRSLRRTKEAARKTAEMLALSDTRLRQETRFVEPPPPAPANPLVQPQQANATAATRYLPRAGAGQSMGGERTVYIPKPGMPGAPGGPGAPGAPTTLLATPETPAKKPWWKNRWTLIVGTSVAAFLIGMLALTGFEALTGHAASGGSGTTFSQVVGGNKGSTPTTTDETTTVTRTQTSHPRSTATSTTEESQQSQTATATPQQTQSQSSAEPTESASPTQSAAPTSG